ncbi:MAG: hypothetical protein V4722_05790 [Bacteroidota bacterium]
MLKSLSVLLITTVLLSCKKDKFNECTSHCKTYSISGRAFDGSTQKGLSEIPIKLKWSYFRFCIFCPGPLEDIYHGKTDVNGNFSFTITVDSTLFADYSLEVIFPEKENYQKDWLGSFTSLNASNNFQVAYYPISNLTIQLHRTLADNFKSLRLVHNWSPIYLASQVGFKEDYEGPIPNGTGDTTINTQTISGLITNVTLWKIFSNGTSIGIKDSLLCKTGAANIVNINY